MYTAQGNGNVASQYGTYAPPQKLGNGRPRKVNPAGLVGALFVPWFIFVAVFCLRSFRFEYEDPTMVGLMCALLLVFCFTFLFMTITALRNSGGTDFRILGFMFITSLIGWAAGFVLGTTNFQDNMESFYDLASLNAYPSVNPSIYSGQELMDAGQIVFTEGSHLDVTKSVGFKNKDIYCVAPIVGGNETGSPQLKLPPQNGTSYDFWAVGINCCSGHIPDYHCGEYSNTEARSGLRLMKDHQRQFFRLAVQEAEIIHKIKATHPVFLYWMKDPQAEVSGYEYDGLKNFYTSMFAAFAIQLFLTVVLLGAALKSS